MSAAEWTIWQAWQTMEPIGGRRLEYAMARTVAWLLLPYSKEGKKPIEPADVVPEWIEQATKASEGLKGQLMALAAAFNSR